MSETFPYFGHATENRTAIYVVVRCRYRRLDGDKRPCSATRLKAVLVYSGEALTTDSEASWSQNVFVVAGILDFA